MADDDVTPSEIASLHDEVTRVAGHLEQAHRERLHCRRGCSSCCVDDLTVFEIEADRIRRAHAELLTNGMPHTKGGCAFLDDQGGCRIYEERPYVCRTQGLPLRWLEQQGDSTLELRDICPLNDEDANLLALEELPAEELWTIGPFEDRLAEMQLRIGKHAHRIALRDLFAAKIS